MGTSVVLDADALVSDPRGRSSILRRLEGEESRHYGGQCLRVVPRRLQVQRVLTKPVCHPGLLGSLRLIGLSVKAAERAGEVLAQSQESGHAIEIRDPLIGCIAREEGLPPLTHVVKHFRRIPGLMVMEAVQYVER